MSSSPTGEAPRVAVFYHLPLSDPYHGGSKTCHDLVEGLRTVLPVEAVAPQARPSSPRPSAVEGSDVAALALRYLMAGSWQALRFIREDSRRPEDQRARVLVAVGYMVAPLVLLWSAVREAHFVYFPLDSSLQISRTLADSRRSGGAIFRDFIWPFEMLAMRRAGTVLVPSEPMRQEFSRAGVASEKLMLCPNRRSLPVRREPMIPEARRRLGLEGRVGVAFVGSFRYPPNVRAYEFVRSQLAPRLESTSPLVRFLVAGHGSEPFVKASGRNLQVLGTVKDLDALLFACDVGIAPMDVPGGTSNKILDYILHGLQVVATPEAAEGMPGSPLLTVTPLPRFADALQAAVERRAREGPHVLRAIDPTYVEGFTSLAHVRAAGERFLALVGPKVTK